MNMRFTIEHNSVITNDPCGVCGARTDPGGLDVFVRERDGSHPQLVCVPCMIEHVPDMHALLQLASAAERFSEFEGISDLEVLVGLANSAREYVANHPMRREEMTEAR